MTVRNAAFAMVCVTLCVTACSRDNARPSADTTRLASGIIWAKQVAVTTNNDGGAAPTFAVAPGGGVLLAWVSATEGGSDGRLVVRRFAHGTASSADTGIVVSELRDATGNMTINGEVPVKLAYAPNGTLYAAYLVSKPVKRGTAKNALRFTASHDDGVTWEAPVTVAQDTTITTSDDHALLVAPDGAVYLTWLAEVAIDTSRAFFAKSTDAGKTWSAPRAIETDLACPCCRTAMAVGRDGALYVAWRKRFVHDVRDIVVAKSSDRGARWSAPVRVYADEWQVNFCPVAGPAIRVGDNGTVHVAWWTGKLGRAGTQYAQSTDGGRTFSAPVELGLAANSRPAHIQLALGDSANAGTVVAAWDDGTVRQPQIVVRVSRDGGKQFSVAETVSDAGEQAAFPTLLLRRDTLLLAWQERSTAASVADLLRKKMREKTGGDHAEAIGSLQVMARRGVLGHKSK